MELSTFFHKQLMAHLNLFHFFGPHFCEELDWLIFFIRYQGKKERKLIRSSVHTTPMHNDNPRNLVYFPRIGGTKIESWGQNWILPEITLFSFINNSFSHSNRKKSIQSLEHPSK